MSELQELFDKDPLSLTREDRSKIIAKYREDRTRFMLGQKAPREKKSREAGPKIDLNLDELDV